MIDCDHKDPGSIGFDAPTNSFRCLICSRPLVVDDPPTRFGTWTRRLVWAAVICVLIALCATLKGQSASDLYTMPPARLFRAGAAD